MIHEKSQPNGEIIATAVSDMNIRAIHVVRLKITRPADLVYLHKAHIRHRLPISSIPQLDMIASVICPELSQDLNQI